jgi:uncharacterized protein YndB with AHSA1/START domain
MPYEFTVSGRIARPLHDVFEAVADPARLSGYFTTGGAQGRLESGATVSWDFHDFPGAFPVYVVEVVPDTRIVLRWDAAPDDDAAGLYQTTVTMTFEALEDGRTLVRIHEAGFRESEAGQRASYGNCEGWTGMLCAMRMWIEHGVNLREGFYK